MKTIFRTFHLIGFLLFTFTNLKAGYSPEKIKEYAAIVNSWNDAHNNWHFKDLESLYAEKVLFYGSSTAKLECISYKTSLASPTKVFIQKVLSEVKATDFGKGIIKCEFTKEVNIDNKIAQYPAYLILKETESGLKIVCESDEITDASFGFHISQDMFQPGAKMAENVVVSPEASNKSTLFLYGGGSLALIIIIGLAAWRRNKNKNKV